MNTTTLFWLSFVDPDLPAGQRFLGGVALEVPDGTNPIQHAWAMNVNPGGEVMLAAFSEAQAAHVSPDMRNRLLTRQEAQTL